mgnify:CR=1 FL=1
MEPRGVVEAKKKQKCGPDPLRLEVMKMNILEVKYRFIDFDLVRFCSKNIFAKSDQIRVGKGKTE